VAIAFVAAIMLGVVLALTIYFLMTTRVVIEQPGGVVRAEQSETGQRHDYIVNNDYGGDFREYQQRVQALTLTNTRVVFNGVCHSACTMYLAVPDKCRTERAVFSFHAPYYTEWWRKGWRAKAYEDLLMAYYPAPVQKWIEASGGLPHVSYTTGRTLKSDLAEYVRVCGPVRG